jgi:hypothetical protein
MLDMPNYFRQLALKGITSKCVISLENSFFSFTGKKRV